MTRAGVTPAPPCRRRRARHSRGVPVMPLVEPGLRHLQRPARHHVRDAVPGPLGGDEGGHGYRPILPEPEGHAALEYVTPHPQLGGLPAQPDQFGPLVLTQPAVALTAAPPLGV